MSLKTSVVKMVRFFTQAYSNSSSTPVGERNFNPMDNGRCLVMFKGQLVPVNQVRHFAEKKKDEEPPKIQRKKENIEPITMPGVVTPDTLRESEYFSKLTKEQIEELRKKSKPPGRPIAKGDN